MRQKIRRTFVQSLFLSAASIVAGCWGANPDYVPKPASCATATPEQHAVWCATDGGAAGDAGVTDMSPTCPVKVGEKTSGFAFYPDWALCPGMVSLPVNGQDTSDTSSVWTYVEMGKPVVFISQSFSTATSADWTLQPGNKPVQNQVTNRWYSVDSTTVSTYSALAAGTNLVGFNRLYANPSLRTVTNGKCPDRGMPGFCFSWQ